MSECPEDELLGSYFHMLSPALISQRVRISVVVGQLGVAACRDFGIRQETQSLISELSLEPLLLPFGLGTCCTMTVFSLLPSKTKPNQTKPQYITYSVLYTLTNQFLRTVQRRKLRSSKVSGQGGVMDLGQWVIEQPGSRACVLCHSAQYFNLMQNFFRANWQYNGSLYIVVYPRLFYKCQHSGKSEENDSLVYSCRDECFTWEGAAETNWKTECAWFYRSLHQPTSISSSPCTVIVALSP